MIAGTILLGGPLGAFFNLPSITIVVGGTLMCCFTMQRVPVVIGALKSAVAAFQYKLMAPEELIEQIVELATKARKEGMLALENEEIDYPYLAKGIRMAIDGATPESIQSVMTIEMISMKTRHEQSQEIFTFMEATAPAMGLIGTLIGLVQMLQNMSDPSSIGPAMAVALLTTFYGAVVAFALIGPVGKKLVARTNEENQLMTITLNGVMAMVSGENPRNIQDQLLSYLAPSMRLLGDEED